MILYHYTCVHGVSGIDRTLTLDPDKAMLWRCIWMTDLDHPDRRGLGLTSDILGCDRTRYRFTVPEPVKTQRWVDVRRQCPPGLREWLESVPGVLPMHWFLSFSRQQVLPRAAERPQDRF